MPVSLERIIRVSAFAAALLVLAQLSVYFISGVGQDPLQLVHTPAEYTQLLLHNPRALRITLAFDNFFVVAFTTMFMALGAQLLRGQVARPLTLVATAGTLILALLDMIENFHFMTMLQAAEHAVTPSTTEISLQVFESMLKFHVGYLSVFMLSLVLPGEQWGHRALRFAMRWWNVPVGVLIYCVPAPYAPVFLFARFGFFLYALISVGALYGAAAPAVSLPRAAAGSSALA